MSRKKLFLHFLLMSELFLVPAFSFSFDISSPVNGFSWENTEEFYKGIQPAASGMVESGMFGMVRNNGKRFHEGIDIKSFSRDNKGRAIDKIYAVLSGKVAHICRENNGSYGKYVVLEHKDGGFVFYTLYAHLSKISDSILEGSYLNSGDFLGIIGDTSTVYNFPIGTEHLHFEIGFRIGGKSFERWYYNKFPEDDENLHSIWNGLNLCGFDPFAFFTASKNADMKSFSDFVHSIPVSFSVYLPTDKVPEIVYLSPGLLINEKKGKVRAWNISFSWNGTPLCFEALDSLNSGSNIKINFVSKKYIQNLINYGILKKEKETFIIGNRLNDILKIIFSPETIIKN